MEGWPNWMRTRRMSGNEGGYGWAMYISKANEKGYEYFPLLIHRSLTVVTPLMHYDTLISSHDPCFSIHRC